MVPEADSSGNEEEEAEVAAGGWHDPVATEIAQLTQQHSQKEPGVSIRSRAAAIRVLQKLLRTNPSLIYQALEQRLQEDWDSSSEALPGVAASQISARYKTT